MLCTWLRKVLHTRVSLQGKEWKQIMSYYISAIKHKITIVLLPHVSKLEKVQVTTSIITDKKFQKMDDYAL